MNRSTPEFDQRIADWLEADPTAAPADVLSTVVAALPSIPQARRGLLAPWRFTQMTNFMRATAGVAIVAIVGVGVLALNLGKPGGGTQQTPGPTATAAASPAAAPTPSPGPSEAAPGIKAFTPYTSAVYGITLGYPNDWRLDSAATRKWQAGDSFDFGPYADVFVSPDGEIGLWVFRVAAESGADIASREGLLAFVCELDASVCQSISDVAEPMCLGRVACLPAVLVPFAEGVHAYFADTETRMVTVVEIGREDSFPGAARYGGSVQLLKSILTTMDVWAPEPGQIPPAT